MVIFHSYVSLPEGTIGDHPYGFSNPWRIHGPVLLKKWCAMDPIIPPINVSINIPAPFGSVMVLICFNAMQHHQLWWRVFMKTGSCDDPVDPQWYQMVYHLTLQTPTSPTTNIQQQLSVLPKISRPLFSTVVTSHNIASNEDNLRCFT